MEDSSTKVIQIAKVEVDKTTFPMQSKNIYKHQRQDENLAGIRENVTDYPDTKICMIDGYEMVCKVRKRDQIHIVIPQTLQRMIMKWYHEFLLHPGQ